MTWIVGSESVYDCRMCGKALWFTPPRHARNKPTMSFAEAVGNRGEGNVVKWRYFHETREDTEACMYLMTIMKGARL